MHFQKRDYFTKSRLNIDSIINYEPYVSTLFWLNWFGITEILKNDGYDIADGVVYW